MNWIAVVQNQVKSQIWY